MTETLLVPTAPATPASLYCWSNPSYRVRLVSASRFKMLYCISLFRVSKTPCFVSSILFFSSTSCCSAASYRAFSDCLMTSAARFYFCTDLINLRLKPQHIGICWLKR